MVPLNRSFYGKLFWFSLVIHFQMFLATTITVKVIQGSSMLSCCICMIVQHHLMSILAVFESVTRQICNTKSKIHFICNTFNIRNTCLKCMGYPPRKNFILLTFVQLVQYIVIHSTSIYDIPISKILGRWGICMLLFGYNDLVLMNIENFIYV